MSDTLQLPALQLGSRRRPGRSGWDDPELLDLTALIDTRAGVEGFHRGERSDPAALQVRVVVDASGLGLEAVISAVLGVLVGVPLAGLLIAALANRLGGRRFGFGSFAMGVVVSIAALVVVVVLWRTIGGEVTGWDLLWATGLTVAAGWSLRRLASRSEASTART